MNIRNMTAEQHREEFARLVRGGPGAARSTLTVREQMLFHEALADALDNCAAKDAQLLIAADALAEEGRVNEAMRCRNATAPGAGERHAEARTAQKEVLANVIGGLRRERDELRAELRTATSELYLIDKPAELADIRAMAAEIKQLRAELAALRGSK